MHFLKFHIGWDFQVSCNVFLSIIITIIIIIIIIVIIIISGSSSISSTSTKQIVIWNHITQQILTCRKTNQPTNQLDSP